MDRERTPSRIPLPPSTSSATPTLSNTRSDTRSGIPTLKRTPSYPQIPVSAVPSRRLSRLPSATQPPKPSATAPAASKRNISSHSADIPIPRTQIADPGKRRVTSSPLVRKPSVRRKAGWKADQNVEPSLARRALAPFGRDEKPPSPTLQQLRKLSGGFVSKLQKGVGKGVPKSLEKSTDNPAEKPPEIPRKSSARALEISLEKSMEKPEARRKSSAISFQNPLEKAPEQPQTPRRSVKGRPPTPFQAGERGTKSPPIPTRTTLPVIIPSSRTETASPSGVQKQPPSTPKKQWIPSDPRAEEFASPASIETVCTPVSTKKRYTIHRKPLPPSARGFASPYDKTGPVNLEETPPRLNTSMPIEVRYSRKPSFPWNSPLASPVDMNADKVPRKETPEKDEHQPALEEAEATPQAKPVGPRTRDAASQTEDLQSQDASSQRDKEAAAEAADGLAFASEERALRATHLITKLKISFDRMRMHNALRMAEVKLRKAHEGKALDLAIIEEVREKLKWQRSVQCFDEVYLAGKSSKRKAPKMKSAEQGGRDGEDPPVFETLHEEEEEEEEGTPTKEAKNESTDTEFENSDLERGPGRKRVKRKLREVKRERRLAGGWKARFGSTLEVPGQRERKRKHADTGAIDTGATGDEDTDAAFDLAGDEKSQDRGKDVPEILVTTLTETFADEQLPKNDIGDNTDTMEREEKLLRDYMEESIEKDNIVEDLKDIKIEDKMMKDFNIEENSKEVNIQEKVVDSCVKETNDNNMEDSNLDEDKTAARLDSECAVAANDNIEPRSPVQQAPDSPMPCTFPEDSDPDLPS